MLIILISIEFLSLWRWDFEANRGTAPRRSPKRRQQAEALRRVGLGSASQQLQGTTCRSHRSRRITQNHADSVHLSPTRWICVSDVQWLRHWTDTNFISLSSYSSSYCSYSRCSSSCSTGWPLVSCLDKSSPCLTWQPDGLSVLGHFGRAQLWLRSSRTTCTLDRKHKRDQNVQMSPGCRGRQWLTNQTTTYNY